MKSILLALFLLAAPLSAAPPASIQWDANPAKERVTAYKIEKKGGTEAAPTWVVVGTVAGNVTTFSLVGQTPGTFTVRAVNAARESGRSNEAQFLRFQVEVDIVIPPQ